MADEVDVADSSSGYDDAIQEPILRAMPGGPELIATFGYVPWFHDDEIERLELVSHGKSRLVLNAAVERSHLAARYCRVTFEIGEIVEMRLQHYHRQNALFALRLRPAGPLDGPGFYGAEPLPDDIELVIEPAVGIEGVIRCRGLSVTCHELRPKRARLRSGEWQ